MKKLKATLVIIMLFIFTYFLQINFFSWFNISGIMPNLFVILVLFVGLFAGKKLGVILGLIIGFILDILLGKTLGFTGIFLAIIGLLGEYFDKNYSKDSRVMIILMSIGGTMLYEIGMYIINIIKFNIIIEIPQFLLNLIVENIFNTLIIIIIYPLMKKIGYYIEDKFKGKEFLTRYF